MQHQSSTMIAPATDAPSLAFTRRTEQRGTGRWPNRPCSRADEIAGATLCNGLNAFAIIGRRERSLLLRHFMARLPFDCIGKTGAQVALVACAASGAFFAMSWASVNAALRTQPSARARH